MVTVLFIEINFFALSILFVIYMSIQYRASGHLIGKKLFLALLGFNALALVLDSLLFIVNGKSGAIVREISLILNTIGYILTTVSLIIWSLYARYQVYRDEKNTKKILIPLIIPACINAVLAILSRFKGYYFFIDENNYYHRGKLFIIYAALCFFYLMYTQIFIIINQKQITRKYFIPLVIFAIPPLIAGILQTAFYGISLVWIGMTVSVLIVSLNIQNDQLYTDHLTGLSNRRYLDRYLQECTRRGNKGNLLAGIMLDLDFFKQINDTWGHSVGDQALVYAGEILEMSFGKDDLICRYGGDEFIVIFEIEKESDLIEAVNRMKMNVLKFGEQNPTPYKINFSIGYDIYDLKSETNAQQFLKHLDSLMYENKKVRSLVQKL